MDIGDSPSEAAFRSEARAWLQQHAPAVTALDVSDLPKRLAAVTAWQQTLLRGGWAGLTWPRRYGGRDASPIEALIFQEEEARLIDWPTFKYPMNVPLNLAAPAIMDFGTDELRALHLPRILRGEEFWCQMFSEPGAGSDLAALSTRAVRDGSVFRVTGQKVWTSYAHLAHYGLLLARTNPDVPKHRGITCFIVDLSTPGVTVRPLRQLTGAHEFNEVFLDDVVIPDSNVLGEVDDGWRVAHAILSSERAYLGAVSITQTKFDRLLQLARRVGRASDPIIRQELADCYAREAILRFFGYRARTQIANERDRGPEASLMKLAQSRHIFDAASLATRLAGPDGALDEPYAPWAAELLGSFGPKIGGGTDNVQLNAIAERLLGLPREDDPHRRLPWRETR